MLAVSSYHLFLFLVGRMWIRLAIASILFLRENDLGFSVWIVGILYCVIPSPCGAGFF